MKNQISLPPPHRLIQQMFDLLSKRTDRTAEEEEFLHLLLQNGAKLNQAVDRKLAAQANACTVQGQIQKAIALYLQAQAWEEAADLLVIHGEELYEKGQARMLFEWLEQLDQAELAHWPDLLLLKGRILDYDLGKPQQAIALSQRAEQEFQQADRQVGAVEALICRSVAHRMMGEASHALSLANTGLDRLNELLVDAPDSVPTFVMAWATRNRGLAYSTAGQTSEALTDLRQSLELFERINKTYYIAMCHHDIGVALAKQGKIGDAETHFEEARHTWETLGNTNDLINTLNSLGVLLCTVGRYDEALKKLDYCFQIATEIEGTRRQSFVLQSMGDANLGRQKYKLALKFYKRSSKLAEQTGVQSLKIANMVKMGECYFYQNNPDKAIELAREARRLAIRAGLVTEKGMAFVLMGKVSMQRDEPCASLFEKAVEYLGEGNAPEQAQARLWWAYSLFWDSRPQAAYEQLQQVVKFALTMNELIPALAQTVAETRLLPVYLGGWAGTPRQAAGDIEWLLKKSPGQAKGLLACALGPPQMAVDEKWWGFGSREVVGRSPELLLYFILEGRGQRTFLSKQICSILWPDVEPGKTQTYFKQIIRKLRNVNGATDYIKKDGFHNYRIECLWCDVLEFERLFERAKDLSPSEALPLQLEMMALYQGEFLEGFELSPWGEAYRAELKDKFLQIQNITKG